MVSLAPTRRVGLPALLPYLRAHRGSLAVVAVLSLVGAGAALVQPLMIRAVLDGVSAARPSAARAATPAATRLAVHTSRRAPSPSSTRATWPWWTPSR